MNSKEKMKLRIERAKRTAPGRFLCRLAGNEAGAVMMEYVVLGVLVVAAVVGLVVAFGDTLAGGLKTMSTAIFHPDRTATTATTEGTASDTSVSAGATSHTTITDQQ